MATSIYSDKVSALFKTHKVNRDLFKIISRSRCSIQGIVPCISVYTNEFSQGQCIFSKRSDRRDGTWYVYLSDLSEQEIIKRFDLQTFW